MQEKSKNPNPSFTQMTDLAAARIGGKTLACSDDFFAEMENLLKPGRGIFIPDKYTDRGKWMDGWESRRRRSEGDDWCVIQLGAEGVIQGVDIDTNHFLGNHPPFASIEGMRNTECGMRNAEFAPIQNVDWHQEASVRWTEILPKSPLNPGSQNFFEVLNREKWTHLKLHIYPDGGVARLKVYGEVAKNWDEVAPGELIDLAAAVHGGKAIACNDEFFSHKSNINMPGRGINMGDGWETKRNRTPGNRDWLLLRLARKGTIQKIIVDTCHFKGNYPDRCMLEGTVMPREYEHVAGGYWTDILPEPYQPINPSTYQPKSDWTIILPEMKLQADAEHVFEKEILAAHQAFTHVRLSIFPDGGVSRLRLFGTVDKDSLTLAELNLVPEALFREKMGKCCGAAAWVEKMLAARPFAARKDLLERADLAWFSCKTADWLEAFSHHSRIGDLASLKKKFAATAAWSSGEQGQVRQADEAILTELAACNDRYFDTFGFIFIVCATGKPAEEMLAILKNRLENDRTQELLNAALEQQKITNLRLEKLVL